jgi:hypothetical protein
MPSSWGCDLKCTPFAACRGQSVLEAFDFSKVRSKEDANLLYEARFGKRGEDGKMSKEQYQ